MQGLSWRRLRALCVKETHQIMRDPSSWIIAVVIPLMLLMIFGYGINLDAGSARVGVIVAQKSPESDRFIQVLQGSRFIEPVFSQDRQALIDQLQGGKIRGIVTLQADFAERVLQGDAQIQLITDGSEPNIASFVQGYMTGAWQIWLQNSAQDQSQSLPNLIDVSSRFWFNPATISRHFILPGALTIIMTVIGSILTSLVVAREWERGTMESLLSTPISRLEFLLSKLLPYYVLGMIALAICLFVAVVVMGVPYRGSAWALLLASSVFLFSVLGIGLLISTLLRNQFNAAMIATNAAFLPAVMLSGFVFEINSMPEFVRGLSHIIPARYFVSILKTLFLAGDVTYILVMNTFYLLIAMAVFLTLTFVKTRRRLE